MTPGLPMGSPATMTMLSPCAAHFFAQMMGSIMLTKLSMLLGCGRRTGWTANRMLIFLSIAGSELAAMIGICGLYWERNLAPPPCCDQMTMSFALRSLTMVSTPWARAAVLYLSCWNALGACG